jgi:predicted metalloprotease
MKWIGRRQSDQVEDRRGSGGGRRIAAGGGIGAIVIALVVYLLGGDPSTILPQENTAATTEQSGERDTTQDQLARYVGVVLADTEDVWAELFRSMNRNYQKPGMVLFTGLDQSGCGTAQAAMGPFYCPADQKIYIDLDFVNELTGKFGASEGDFPIAYVVAHEVGHHIQTLTGVTQKSSEMRSRLSAAEYNKWSVKVELQADFYAGIWAHYNQKMKNVLEPGDIEEALSAAAAVGDDRIQKRTQGRIVPDAFTHGTAEQRMYWFKKGFSSGDLSQGDTFNSN